MNKLNRLLRELGDFRTGNSNDFDPDNAGVTNHFFKSQQIGDDDFPYGGDSNPDHAYGQPKAKSGVGNASAEPGHFAINIPMDTSHTIYDPDNEYAKNVKEIIGSPTLMSKSGYGYGSNVPGMAGGFADSPLKSWDDDGDTDDLLNKYGQSTKPVKEEFDFRQPTIQSVMKTTDFDDTSDKSLEKTILSIYSNGYDDLMADIVEPNDVFMPDNEEEPFSSGLGDEEAILGLVKKATAWDKISDILNNAV